MSNSFLTGSFLSVTEQGFSSAASFLTAVIIARGTNPQTAGSYALTFSVCLFLMSMQRVFVAIPFNVNYPKISDSAEQSGYRASMIGMEIILLSGTSLLIFLLGLLGFRHMLLFVFSVAIFYAGSLFNDFMRQFFYGIDKMLSCTLLSAAQCAVQLLALLVLSHCRILTLLSSLLAIGISYLATGTLFLIPYGPVCLRKKPLMETWRKNKKIAGWSVGISLSDSAKNQISVWVLKAFTSLSQVGIYTNNLTIAMLPQPAFNGISQFMLPYFSKLFSEKDYRQINSKFRYTFGLVAVSNFIWIVFLILFGKRVIALLYGKEYVTTTAVMVLCSLRGMFNCCSNITASILQATERPSSILLGLAAGIFSLCTAGVWLTWKYQVLGMSLAMMALYLISSGVQVAAIARNMRSMKQPALDSAGI